MTGTCGLSVLIPAHNEALEIAQCLDAVFASDPLPDNVSAEVLLLANGCTDNTVALAKAHPVQRNWSMKIVEIAAGGKLNALNQGDKMVQGHVRIYLDADVRVSPPLIANLYNCLTMDAPAYASGQPDVIAGKSLVSRAYGHIWRQLPFVTHGVPGFGLFAMNTAGRDRWEDWPQIIADDTFARLMFAPTERHTVAGSYQWPLVQGFRNLVRVRRRQNEGVNEIAHKYPSLLDNDDKFAPDLIEVMRLFATAPFGFLVYAAVTLAVKTPLFQSKTRWTRGR